MMHSIKDWWLNMSASSMPNRKAMTSLTMLTCWTIWGERNTRVSRHKSTLPSVLLSNIQSDVNLWVIASAKHLGQIMSEE